MTIFAQLDANGLPNAFYRTDVHGDDGIPPNLQEISEDQWNDCLANPGTRQWSAATGDFVPYAAPVPPVDLTAYAAAARYKRQTSGVTINGSVIATDPVSQGLIAGMVTYAQLNPNATISFKSATGWVSITAAQAIAIGQAVGSRVQACFAAEQMIDAEIVAGTITTTALIDQAFAAIP